MEHHFNVEVAKMYGVEEAILIHNIFFWVKKNVANDRHKHDGRYWTYNSSKAFAELFPYFNEKKIYRLLSDMCQKKILIKGNFNKNAFDRTMWYSLSDETLSVLDKEKYDISQMSESYDEKCIFHFSKMGNGFSESEEPIPYSNTDSKQDNKEERDKSLSKKDSDDDSVSDWRSDFMTYLTLVRDAASELKADAEFRALMLKYHPGIDYAKSVDKSVDLFWGTERGWRHKLKSKSKGIDMAATLRKNIEKSLVYIPKDGKGWKSAYDETQKKDDDRLFINGVEYR